MSWNYPIPNTTLEAYRKAAGATQEEMARHMHIPLRTYEDIAGGKSVLRPVHTRAAEGAFLFLARERGDASFLPEHLRQLVLDLAEIVQAGNKKPAS